MYFFIYVYTELCYAMLNFYRSSDIFTYICKCRWAEVRTTEIKMLYRRESYRYRIFTLNLQPLIVTVVVVWFTVYFHRVIHHNRHVIMLKRWFLIWENRRDRGTTSLSDFSQYEILLYIPFTHLIYVYSCPQGMCLFEKETYLWGKLGLTSTVI